jgi:GTPase SAR1 family protein
MNKLPFHLKLISVGGQRVERKKWPMDSISVILFIAALSDYDALCYEDDVTNRMKESIELFHQNQIIFKDIPIYLIFNKKDRFLEKLKYSHLKTTFPEFQGRESHYEDAIEFIKKLYFSKKEEKYFFIDSTNLIETKDCFNEILENILIKK